MHEIAVGKPYLPGRASVSERAEYNFRSGQHELLLCLREVSKRQVASVRSGDAEFALVIHGSVIFLLYRFADAVAWSDAPYSWHLVPTAERQLPAPRPSPASYALLRVILVDAGRNVVRALRAVTFSPVFTDALERAIADQATRSGRREDYDRDLREAYRTWPSTEAMLAAAVARSKGGE